MNTVILVGAFIAPIPHIVPPPISRPAPAPIVRPYIVPKPVMPVIIPQPKKDEKNGN